MANAALIVNGIVQNVVVITDGDAPPFGYIDIGGQVAAIGWAYVDGVVIAPPPAHPVDEPQSPLADILADLEARQAQLAADIAALKG